MHFYNFLPHRLRRQVNSFIIKDKDRFILYGKYHGCWWTGDANKQDISHKSLRVDLRIKRVDVGVFRLMMIVQKIVCFLTAPTLREPTFKIIDYTLLNTLNSRYLAVIILLSPIDAKNCGPGLRCVVFVVIRLRPILPISFLVSSSVLEQTYDCLSPGEVTLTDLGKWIT